MGITTLSFKTGTPHFRLSDFEKAIYFVPRKLEIVAAAMPSILDKIYHGLLPMPAYFMHICITPILIPNPTRETAIKEK
jgi:hypothetical protein